MGYKKNRKFRKSEFFPCIVHGLKKTTLVVVRALNNEHLR